MKFNPDCVRDILFAIEELSDGKNTFTVKQMRSTKYLRKYDVDEINYFLSQCNQSGLLDGVSTDILGYTHVKDLTPEGHKFLSQIRSDTTWKKILNTGASALIFLMQTAAQIAPGIISDQLK